MLPDEIMSHCPGCRPKTEDHVTRRFSTMGTFKIPPKYLADPDSAIDNGDDIGLMGKCGLCGYIKFFTKRGFNYPYPMDTSELPQSLRIAMGFGMRGGTKKNKPGPVEKYRDPVLRTKGEKGGGANAPYPAAGFHP